jgi:hypothetical protein
MSCIHNCDDGIHRSINDEWIVAVGYCDDEIRVRFIARLKLFRSIKFQTEILKSIYRVIHGKILKISGLVDLQSATVEMSYTDWDHSIARNCYYGENIKIISLIKLLPEIVKMIYQLI